MSSWVMFAALISSAGGGVTLSWAHLSSLDAHRSPGAYSISYLDLKGEIEGRRARLQLKLQVESLDEGWTIIPLLPSQIAIANATVEHSPKQRAALIRESGHTALAVAGAGRYAVHLQVETSLRSTPAGLRLTLPADHIVAGRARLKLQGQRRIGGATGWRIRKREGGFSVEGAVGAQGVDLLLRRAKTPPAPSAGLLLRDLDAVTVVELGGRGVTRITVQVRPGREPVRFRLPAGATLWRAYLGGKRPSTERISSGQEVVLSMKRPATVELAYTFAAPRLGIRGRYRLGLVQLPAVVQNARWELWLPQGLRYEALQASLQRSECAQVRSGEAKTTLALKGTCFAFTRTVLPPTAAYITGRYAQPL